MQGKQIQYDGPSWISCDRNCAKAWGIALRPCVKLSDTLDDVVYLADGELPLAPSQPGTFEGGYGKPQSTEGFPNKWCVRQCERSRILDKDSIHFHPQIDWSQRVVNLPWEHYGSQIKGVLTR